jgi:hypothetical protein
MYRPIHVLFSFSWHPKSCFESKKYGEYVGGAFSLKECVEEQKVKNLRETKFSAHVKQKVKL